MPDKDIEDAVKRVYEAIESARNETELERWARALLISGLERLAVTLKFLKFFGHEAVVAELILAYGKIRIVHKRYGKVAAVYAALTAINTIGGLLILPDQGLTALDHYTKSWHSAAIEEIVAETPSPGPLLITGPQAALKPDEPSVVEGKKSAD